MLQPRQSGPEHQLAIAKILWTALTVSMFLYGAILFTSGKLSGVFVPQGELLPIEQAALSMNLLAIFVFWFHKNKVSGAVDIDRRMTGQIICWALSEAIVTLGFISVFITDQGNALVYLTNLCIGFSINALTFPKQ